MWVARVLLPLCILVALCHCQDLASVTCPADRSSTDVYVTGANILLGGLFELRERGSLGYGCGPPVQEMTQVFEATRFALKYLNDNNYVPGVKFGMKAYETCGISSVALNGIQKVFPQSTSSDPFCSPQQTVTPGLLSALKSSPAMAVADLAGRIPASVVSPTATSSVLSQKFKYPTFLRTVPSGAILAKAMIKLLETLKFENVMVMYTDSAASQSLFQKLLTAAHQGKVCVSKAVMVKDEADKEQYKKNLQSLGPLPMTGVVFIGTDSRARTMLQAADETPSAQQIQWMMTELDITRDISGITRARGVQVVLPKSTLMTQFRDYFVGLELNPNNNVGNPWFKDWYEAKYNCRLSVNCPTQNQNDLTNKFVQSYMAEATVKAIFAYAETVKSVCGSGFCSSLKTMSSTDFQSRLKGINFQFPSSFNIDGLRNQLIKFNANGDPEVTEFTLYNYNNRRGNFAWEVIGSFASDSMTLAKQPMLYDQARNNQIAPTPQDCATLGCNNCLLPRQPFTFRHMPGDVVIASLVNGHMPGSAPYSCGAGIGPGLASLVAAEWAIGEYKRQNPNKLKGVSVGCLMADVCPDSSVAEGFLIDLLSGNNRLVSPSGQVVFGNDVQAFVDHTNDVQAMAISSILDKYMIPEVQTWASTSQLSGAKSPYFSRAVPNSEVYFTAIASLLQKLGWKYVQVATRSSGEYHQQTMVFRQVAAKYGVCVAGVEDVLDGDSTAVYTRLKANPWKTVVVIASVADMQGLLAARSADVSSTVQFISGTPAFNRDPELIKRQGGGSPYSVIVVEPELAENSGFKTWLSGQSTSQITSNVFLKELYEMTNQCSLDVTSRGTYSRACGAGDSFSKVYQGQTAYVIQSIYLVAEKLHEVIAEVCGKTDYDGLCNNFRAAVDISQKLATKLRNSGPMQGGLEIKDGEGITNFKIYYQAENLGGVSYSQLAVFDSEKRQLTQESLTALGNYAARADDCPGVCVQCQYMYMLQSGYFVPGDYVIAGAFTISNPGPEGMQPFICGNIRQANGPQYTTAMMYAIDQVNKGTAPVSVKGFTIGGLALDHCNNKGRMGHMVADIYSHSSAHRPLDNGQILSWMIDSSGKTVEAATYLDPLDIAMVSPSATAANLVEDYSTFHRSVQGDATSVQALIKVIKYLKFPYVQMVYSPTSFGRGGLKTMTAIGKQEGVCITGSVELDPTKMAEILATLKASPTGVVVLYTGSADTQRVLEAVANDVQARDKLVIMLSSPFTALVTQFSGRLKHPIIALQLAKSPLKKYNEYLATSPTENPYFARYYMDVKKCNLPGYSLYTTACPATPNLASITADPSFTEDAWIEPTINAVYASVDALDRTIKEFCGVDYTEPCPQFKDAQNWRQRYNALLSDANFVSEAGGQFRFLDREGNTAYNIMRNNVKVGSFAGVALDMKANSFNLDATQLSQCTAPCLECVVRGLNFSFTAGDIYLAGLFDVHEASLSPFTCGKIRKLHGFLLLEAFHYALKQVNDKKGAFANILKGTRLGGVGFDGCGSQVRGGYIISNINNGMFSLSKEGIFIEPDEIDAYIGAYDSGASVYMARILTDLQIPQISYASSSVVLSDKRTFPFFYRTVPTDVTELTALLSFLDRMNIRYVQVLYKDNYNGKAVLELFKLMMGKHRVCMAQAVGYPFLGVASDEQSNYVVEQLIDKPTANTVISFLDTYFTNSILKAVGKNDRAKGKLRFFGGSAWADNQDAIEDAENIAVDSLTIKLDSDDVEDFERYMSSRTLSNSEENPWFEEYYQEMYQCYTSVTDTRGYSRQCPLSLQKIINSPGYQQDPGVVYVINAVYAAAFALDKTLKKYCGPSYTAVCQAYRNNVLRRIELSDQLASVTFTDPVGRPFEFIERAAPASYRFNNIVKGIFGGASYEQIGSFNVTTSEVMINPSYKPTWDSSCDRKDVCAECPTIRNAGLRWMVIDSEVNLQKDATTVVVFVDLNKAGADLYRCGEINMPGFQNFLAFMYSKDIFRQIILNTLPNNSPDSKYSKGIRFLVIDTCSNNMRVDQDLFGLLNGNGLCNTDFDKNKYTVHRGNIGAVVSLGGGNTLAVARALEGSGITFVSPDALSPVLDNYLNLARTISPTSGEVEAAVALMNKMGWSYVDVIYQDSLVGVLPYRSLNKISASNRVCQGSYRSVALDASENELKAVFGGMSAAKGSQVAVLLGSPEFNQRVIQAAVDNGDGNRYIWMLVSPERDLDYSSLRLPKDYDLKILTMRRMADRVKSFDTDYMANLKYDPLSPNKNNGQIPAEWFEHFFQNIHDCHMRGAKKPINQGKRDCDPSMRVDPTTFRQEPGILNTIAATYAVASGLNSALTYCNSLNCYQNLDTIRSDIRGRILNSTRAFQGPPSTPELYNSNLTLILRFNSKRWWDTGYRLSMWTSKRGVSEVFSGPIPADPWTPPPEVKVESKCIPPGSCGCSFTEYSAQSQVAPKLTQSIRNYLYYENDDAAPKLTREDEKYEWPIWAIVLAVLTVFGFACCLLLFLILLFAYPIKGGTTILGYLAIFGILCIYAINIAFFFPASDATCGIRRFLMGVVYMITFAPLLIKAIDNWRLGHVDYASEDKRYSGFSSACMLFISALGLVLIQCIIPIMWLILVNPTATDRGYPGALEDNMWCDPVDDYDLGLVCSMIFVIFIVFVTSFFAAKGYDTDRNSYESRWILFACVVTAGCFLVWMVVTTNADAEYRDPAVAIANFVNATLLFLILPLRKTVLMCQAMQEKDDEKIVPNGGPYDNYSGYHNTTFELNDYDHQYAEG